MARALLVAEKPDLQRQIFVGELCRLGYLGNGVDAGAVDVTKGEVVEQVTDGANPQFALQ